MDFNNLGWVQAVHKGSSSPTNTDMLWFDTAVGAMKYYDTTQSLWLSIVPDLAGLVFSDTFNTVNAQVAYTRPNLSGRSIVAVKMGQYFLDNSEYSLASSTFTLTTAPDGVIPVTVLFNQ